MPDWIQIRDSMLQTLLHTRPQMRPRARFRKRHLVLGWALPSLAWGAAVVTDLPYSTRTRPYSGYSATTRGDIRTVGMAGATLGLADTFAAAGDNPAGLTMTMNVGDTHASSNQIRDARVQSIDAPIQATGAGAALSLSNWGFSLGAFNTWGEGQFYRIPAGGGGESPPLLADLFIREFRVGVSHRFPDLLTDLPLSLGAQLRFGELRQSLGSSSQEFSNPAVTDATLGLTVGALLRLPRRFILGASLSTAMNYDGRSHETNGTDPFASFAGFVQPVHTPVTGGLGLGFIPSRIFRADFSLKFAGSTPGAALLSNQSRTVGTQTTWEPRLGAAYVFGDFRAMRATAFAGTYLEPARITDTSARLHATGGVELKWSFVNFGLGFDFSSDYRNTLASVGIDPFAVMERLGLIPPPPAETHKGFLPSAMRASEEGLPASLQNKKTGNQPRSTQSGPDPLEIGTNIPKKVQQKVRNFKAKQVIDTLKELPSDISEDIQEVSREIKRKLKKPY